MGKEITFDKFIRWAGVTLIVLAVLYMTNYLSSVLLPFFIAWFFAYLLYPVVKFIENKLHVRIRALSILIAMGTAIAVIGGVLWLQPGTDRAFSEKQGLQRCHQDHHA